MSEAEGTPSATSDDVRSYYVRLGVDPRNHQIASATFGAEEPVAVQTVERLPNQLRLASRDHSAPECDRAIDEAG